MKKTMLAVALIATSQLSYAANVLVVLSDSNQLTLQDGKNHPTGFYLNELMQPVKLLIDNGDTVTFATPLGKVPTLDQASVNKKDFGGDQHALDTHLELLNQLKITDKQHSPVISLSRVEQIGYDHFDAVFVPGGHAPMQDLVVSPQMGSLLRAFHQAGKTTALVCHGPIALISALPDVATFIHQLEKNPQTTAHNWIYAGYKMTSFTNPEEVASEGIFNGGKMKFTPQTALTAAGAEFSAADEKWQSHVITDRELITGQNPASAMALGKLLVSRLHSQN
ncbi:type 1 glutamine amidotransferase domain-containing protein [Erwinia mallotivora]|uniref:Thiamine biosynthesis protein ThiJ n=1 Tax=Erwinia mallotivora TaxID=69222 RepID=A0A014PZ55_9GAMM|nr:type 1 glutamine amidotransferase domain-containing protein [Erwinia mallotivora]EXU76242.1 thiamine biosynthesis protein ThiJ [Erwinia mallotivora]